MPASITIPRNVAACPACGSALEIEDTQIFCAANCEGWLHGDDRRYRDARRQAMAWLLRRDEENDED